MRRTVNVAHGFTMVELMVGLAISSFLLLGLTNIFVSATRSQDAQTSVSDIHETGRFAIDQLARHIRMTGSRSSNWSLGPIPNALVAVDNASDTLTLVYEDTVDCNLNPAGAAGFVTNVFDVLGGTLRCNGQELIDGVAEMQVFLGEDTDADFVANRLVAPGTAGLQMNRVVSINVNLLVMSRNDRVATGKTELKGQFWNTAPDADDRRIWREYSTTVSIRSGL